MDAMAPQARFIIRPEGEKSKCIIGVNLTGSTLKPGMVYEIVEALGEYVIREVGAPAMPETAWGYTVNDIMESFGGAHLMTRAEYDQVRKTIEDRENSKNGS